MRRTPVAAIVALVAATAFATGVIPGRAAARAPRLAVAPATPIVTIGGSDPVAPIASGFVGLSMEYQSAAEVAGPPGDANTVFEQLVRNLTPGQAPVLRIGGDSTDHTYWPAAGLKASPGLQFALTPAWLQSIDQLANDLSAELIMGINLEDDSPTLAATEENALVQGIGRNHIEAFEVGNEPNLYSSLPWYRTAEGLAVDGRRPGYDYRDYAHQFDRVVASLGATPLAGPALGSPKWMTRLPTILNDNPELQIVTYHRYPLDRCYTAPTSPMYPTIANLLSRAGTTGLAASISPFAAIARADGRQFRVDELNSVACEGQPGVSDTFASALWVLDTLFAFAREGVNGVNIHTFPTAAYRLFSFASTGGSWSAAVAPEYYGMLMFAQAAPPGSQLLETTSSGDPGLAVWATRTASQATNVVLINKSGTRPAAVTIEAPADPTSGTTPPGTTSSGTTPPGTTPPGTAPPASVDMLTAPGLTATAGVTIGGTSFATPTTTGLLSSPEQSETVAPASGTYTVVVPAASAALVTIPGS